ncbi:MAG: pseudaminic acid cytidylyltransferase, partial [Pseudomonadota bacterium]
GEFQPNGVRWIVECASYAGVTRFLSSRTFVDEERHVVHEIREREPSVEVQQDLQRQRRQLRRGRGTLRDDLPPRAPSTLPRKNIADFNGKPLIVWSIETALNSAVFSRVVVSTDDEEIAEISRKSGAETPFVREAALADDFATTADVLKDALSKLPMHEHACCLYPTAPMITAANLQEADAKIGETGADCVLSVTAYDFHPLRAFSKSEDNTLAFHWPEHELTRSQDLPEMLHDAGAFYFFNVKALLKTGKLIGQNTIGIELPRNQAVDIDTQEDFELARTLHKLNQEGRQ